MIRMTDSYMTKKDLVSLIRSWAGMLQYSKWDMAATYAKRVKRTRYLNARNIEELPAILGNLKFLYNVQVLLQRRYRK